MHLVGDGLSVQQNILPRIASGSNEVFLLSRWGIWVVRLNVLLLEDSFPSELLRNISDEPKLAIERVQTGVRIERRMLKVLKGLAEYHEVSLGELLEDIVLHAFEGVSTFDGATSRERIAALKEVYNMDYDAHAGPRFAEAPAGV